LCAASRAAQVLANGVVGYGAWMQGTLACCVNVSHSDMMVKEEDHGRNRNEEITFSSFKACKNCFTD